MLTRHASRAYPQVVPGRHARQDPTRPGDGLVRIGAIVFGLGFVAVVVAVVPFLVSGETGEIGPVVAAGSLLPIGFAIAMTGLLRGARTARRAARER